MLGYVTCYEYIPVIEFNQSWDINLISPPKYSNILTCDGNNVLSSAWKSQAFPYILYTERHHNIIWAVLPGSRSMHLTSPHYRSAVTLSLWDASIDRNSRMTNDHPAYQISSNISSWRFWTTIHPTQVVDRARSKCSIPAGVHTKGLRGKLIYAIRVSSWRNFWLGISLWTLYHSTVCI